ncbi:hypothetical protein J2X31_001159 [Flavobacterium arsenatis]|uniref:Secretion system C-terminal sorting domain-containing protein n=1 Tax=Flavobacterium arsenatis TaxID=1484332 RepID=A0ABU1TMV9_9FLAO|nr:T9SS type A sorting domain-containing protein [Flavobacterium arsenatis]MDR6967152.1 hypothetical protein [Flavobacterium arsenatis]
MKKTLLFLLFFVVSSASAQQDLIFLNIDTPTALCNAGDCFQLTTNYLDLKSTSQYSVASINYNPLFSFTGGTLIDISLDDQFTPVSLPFSFCFYGNVYQNTAIGSNGVVAFNQTSTECPYAFTAQIPNVNFPIKNAIYGVYQDTDITASSNFTVQNINYYTTGIAPNRVFVINYNELPLYQCSSSGLQTYQIALYETTNIIDVYVKKRTSCTSANFGNGLIGIQNQAGTNAVVPTGRNTGNWITTNEAWRFSPSGSSLTNSFIWSLNGATLPNETQNSLTICPEDGDTITVTRSINKCDGSQIDFSSSLDINFEPTPGFSNPVDLVICSENAPFTVDLTTNSSTVLNSLNPDDYIITYHQTQTGAEELSGEIQFPETYTFVEDEVIYMRIENFNSICYYVFSFTISASEPPSAPQGLASQGFMPGETLQDLEVIGENIQWYDDAFEGNLLPNTTPLQENVTYYASQTNEAGCESLARNPNPVSNRLAVTVYSALGINNYALKNVKFYPNPVKNTLNVEAESTISLIEIYNSLGQKIITNTNSSNKLFVDLSDVSSGVYLIKIYSEENIQFTKIIKN